MPRPKASQPNYYLHKPTGQAYCRVPDGKGGRRTVYLGVFNSPESKLEHARILAELAVTPGPAARPPLATQSPRDITLNEVYLAFRRHAEGHYRRSDGTP